jgi:hypothetical protein
MTGARRGNQKRDRTKKDEMYVVDIQIYTSEV